MVYTMGMNRVKKVLTSRWATYLYLGLIALLMALLLFWQTGEMKNWETDYRRIMDDKANAWYDLFSLNLFVFEELFDFPGGLDDDKTVDRLRRRLDFWRRESEEPDLVRTVLRIGYKKGKDDSVPGEDGVWISELGEEGFHSLVDTYWQGIARKSLARTGGQVGLYTFSILTLEGRSPCLTIYSGKEPVFYILELDAETFFGDFLERVTRKVFGGNKGALDGMVPAVLRRGAANAVLYSLAGKGRETDAYLIFALSHMDTTATGKEISVEAASRSKLLDLEIDAPFYIYYWMKQDQDPFVFQEDEMKRWKDLVDPSQDVLFFAYLPKNLTLEQMALLRTIPFLVIGYLALALLGAALITLNRYSRENSQLLIRQEEFVSSLTHELRTPLHIISNGAGNLADGVIRNQQDTVRYGKIMKKEAERLSGMIESILTYSGVSSREPDRQILDINVLLEEILNPYRILCREKGILLEENLQKDILYKGDQEALKLILSNLLSNAIKYGELGKQIRVSVNLWEELVLSVRDWGPGIPKRDMARITEPFYRGQRRGDEPRFGNGLGLSIVKRIAEKEGGRLVIVSTENEGSTFSIHLPSRALKDATNV